MYVQLYVYVHVHVNVDWWSKGVKKQLLKSNQYEERQKKLKEQYGDASKKNTASSDHNIKKKKR